MNDAVSAGLLVYRATANGPEFLLVHPGGPFWKNKDAGAWSIPKGLVDAGEELLAAARREFAEETGLALDPAAIGRAVALAPCRLPSRKIVHAWLVEADLDTAALASNAFEIEWPPRSGRCASFPEVDRAAYFGADKAVTRIHRGQSPLLREAIDRLRQPTRDAHR